MNADKKANAKAYICADAVIYADISGSKAQVPFKVE